MKSIMKCPFCDKKINGQTQFCPLCGKDIQRQTRFKRLAWIGLILGYLGSILMLFLGLRDQTGNFPTLIMVSIYLLPMLGVQFMIGRRLYGLAVAAAWSALIPGVGIISVPLCLLLSRSKSHRQGQKAKIRKRATKVRPTYIASMPATPAITRKAARIKELEQEIFNLNYHMQDNQWGYNPNLDEKLGELKKELSALKGESR